MSVVVLDATPLGMLAHPRNPPHVAACRQWLAALVAAGRRVVVPEIADYEVRRELLRHGSGVALASLDTLCAQLDYQPLTTAAMRLAATLWAQARQTGQQTAGNLALDGDVILAAQTRVLNVAAVVATSNPAHLTRFVAADLWQNITP